MHDDDGSYPAGMRAGAVLALLAVAAVGFILLDVALGGKLTKGGGCGCGDGEVVP